MVLSGIFRKSEGPARDPFLKALRISHEKQLSPDDVQDICASVGWSRREPELIAKALDNSLAVVSIWDKEIIVGFARATGDMVFNATIWDMVVRPDYQNRGIGRLVMIELLKDLDDFGIPLITLYADPGTDGFYKKFGFLADPSGVRGMFRESG
ncbi:MAG: GNAT family N-acetyltransferase [Cyanobacteria bacterium HKST-UBA01]|nr:GNAT family N-acetyltransferase [Cyanobacteria bacterium HKST-UBA01]